MKLNTLSRAIVIEEMRKFCNYIQSEKYDTSENFIASQVWFHQFKNRNNFYNIHITREAASADANAATVFAAILKAILE